MRLPLLVALLCASGLLDAQPTPARSARDTLRRDTVARPIAGVQVVERADDLPRIPGSVTVLGERQLGASRPVSVEEALRKVTGVHARIEDGIGLRPHVGLRGLDPQRSRKVLLLEDGLPFVLAPYGDADSYYAPPIERFDRIEVIKGAGQVRFGPSTIGGVINFQSAPIPRPPRGRLQVTGGSPGLTVAQGRWGGTFAGVGVAVDALRKQADLTRDATNARLDDLTFRSDWQGARHALALKLNGYRERSAAPYTGLTEAEWAANPRFNPFRNDVFETRRRAGSLAHRARVGGADLATTAYTYGIRRQNWRQSGNSAQRPSDASDPACGGMANLLTTCGNEGRVRNYRVTGLEHRVRAPLAWTGDGSDVELGGRLLWESQDRYQINAATPTGRDPGPPTNRNSGLVESNWRTGMGASVYLQPRVVRGAWTFTPGVRVERVALLRRNRLLATPAAPDGVAGDTVLLEVIPGAGLTWERGRTTLFAGAHRGFAPPRTEDLISNSTGGTADLGPELSWNYETGARGRVGDGVRWEATAFAMDFENQIIPQSTAGGTGTAVTNAGRTSHRGVELGLDYDRPVRAGSPHRLIAQVATTWLPVARFDGQRYAFVGTTAPDVPGKVYPDQNGAGTRQRVATSGRRLPYAPRSLVTTTVGWAHRRGFDVRVEQVFTGGQFGDPVNTDRLVPDGQQGPIPSATTWNASVNWTWAARGATLFASAKNLTDQVVLVDRSRGLMPAMGRVVLAGVRWEP
jgi:Fe(3+) dicitrate transport protein